MRFFLDSSYFFPLIGIDTSSIIDNNFIPILFHYTDVVFFSDITILELSAKCGKLITKGIITGSDARDGIEVLLNDDRFRMIEYKDPMIIELAWKLRQYHKDFLDCLIIASARLTTNTLVTEDSIILDSLSKNPILGMIEEKNDSFTCETSKEVFLKLGILK